VGYADSSRFGVHFRQRYGLTPRAYRQRFGGGRRTEAEAWPEFLPGAVQAFCMPNSTNSKPNFDTFGAVYYLGW